MNGDCPGGSHCTCPQSGVLAGSGPDYPVSAGQPDNVRDQLARALADTQKAPVWLEGADCLKLADALLPVIERALDRSNQLAFQAGWNHATARWEQRAAATHGHGCCPNGQHGCCCKAAEEAPA